MINTKELKKKLEYNKKVKEQQSKKKQNTQLWLKLKQGVNYIMIAPPHPNMKGIPYIVRRVHFGLGPDKNLTATCLRDNETQPIDNCEACKEAYMLYKKGQKENASRIRVKSREIIQVLDFTDFVNSEGLEGELPDCLFQYGTTTGCNKCSAMTVCQTKFQIFTLPISVSEEIMGDIEDLLQTNDLETLEQIFDMRHGWLYRIKKKGEDIETRYTNIKRVNSNIKLSKKAYALAMEELYDLTTLLVKLSPEDMRTLMDEGIIMSGEEGSSSDIPECFGDIDKFDENKCVDKCSYVEVCLEEIENQNLTSDNTDREDEDEDEDEDDVKDVKETKKGNKTVNKSPKVERDEDEDEDEDEVDGEDQSIDEDDDEDEVEDNVSMPKGKNNKKVEDEDEDEDTKIDDLKARLAKLQNIKRNKK